MNQSRREGDGEAAEDANSKEGIQLRTLVLLGHFHVNQARGNIHDIVSYLILIVSIEEESTFSVKEEIPWNIASYNLGFSCTNYV